MIVNKINAYLDGEGKSVPDALLNEVCALAKGAFARQFGVREERKAKSPYFSSIGKCVRQQAYDLLGFEAEGKTIDARAKMVFFMGDLAEIAIIQVAKQAGCAITACGTGQESTEWEGMRGRPDGVLDGTHLVEAKSMSSFAFKNFEIGLIDEGYRYQCNAGMEALGLSSCVIVALNKDAGVLAEQLIMKDPAIVADMRLRLALLKAATKDNLPERGFSANEKGFYPWNCLYCAHWKTCLPNAEKVLVSKKYKLKEKAHETHATA